MTLCFICGKMTNLFTYEIKQHTEGGMICTVVTWIDVSLSVPSFQIQCYQRPWWEKKQSVPQQ